MKHTMFAVQYKNEDGDWRFDHSDDMLDADGLFYFDESKALDYLREFRFELSSHMSMEEAKKSTRIVKILVQDWGYHPHG